MTLHAADFRFKPDLFYIFVVPPTGSIYKLGYRLKRTSITSARNSKQRPLSSLELEPYLVDLAQRQLCTIAMIIILARDVRWN